jgi:hypothetical protein
MRRIMQRKLQVWTVHRWSIGHDLLDSSLSDTAADVNPWLDGKSVTHAHGMPYQSTRQEMTPERKELTLRGS